MLDSYQQYRHHVGDINLTTKIEWVDETWNPIVGCTKISPGCNGCYAARMAHRLGQTSKTPQYKGTTKGKGEWSGKIRFVEHLIEKPRSWNKPKRVFVCSMGDIFHENTSEEWIEVLWNKMLEFSQHTYMILTKRPGRMQDFISKRKDRNGLPLDLLDPVSGQPKNIWLGVTAENQAKANERIPILLNTPAAKRFASVEPMLGRLDLAADRFINGLDWVLCGGETGPKARPMHPKWVHLLRNQCKDAGVPFFFKQWGEFYTKAIDSTTGGRIFTMYENKADRKNIHDWSGGSIAVDMEGRIFRQEDALINAVFPVAVMHKMKRKEAGHLIDGREFREIPET